MLGFKDYLNYQRQNGVSTSNNDEVQKHFNSYKIEHINHQAEQFFRQHKDECWFREKYDPQQAYRQKLESCGQAQAAASKFLEEFVDELLVKGETATLKPKA